MMASEEKFIVAHSHGKLVDLINQISFGDLNQIQSHINTYQVMKDLQDDLIKHLSNPQKMDLLETGKIDARQTFSYFLVNEIVNELLPIDLNNTLRELVNTPTVKNYGLMHLIIQDYIMLLRDKLSQLFQEYRDLAVEFKIGAWQFPKNIGTYLMAAIFQVIPGEVLGSYHKNNEVIEFAYLGFSSRTELTYGSYNNKSGQITFQI